MSTFRANTPPMAPPDRNGRWLDSVAFAAVLAALFALLIALLGSTLGATGPASASEMPGSSAHSTPPKGNLVGAPTAGP
jgi:hypothetical protein